MDGNGTEQSDCVCVREWCRNVVNAEPIYGTSPSKISGLIGKVDDENLYNVPQFKDSLLGYHTESTLQDQLASGPSMKTALLRPLLACLVLQGASHTRPG